METAAWAGAATGEAEDGRWLVMVQFVSAWHAAGGGTKGDGAPGGASGGPGAAVGVNENGGWVAGGAATMGGAADVVGSVWWSDL